MSPADTAGAVERYGAMVYRMAYAQTRSRHDADDIFQEVFLRYHRAAPSFESEEHRKAWLLRVTVNCARSLFTAPWRQRSVPLEDVYAYTDPAESAVDTPWPSCLKNTGPLSISTTTRAMARRRSPGS